MKTDIYKQVTDKIIADLEQGELTWLKPWSSGKHGRADCEAATSQWRRL